MEKLSFLNILHIYTIILFGQIACIIYKTAIITGEWWTVDTPVLGTGLAIGGGSSPLSPTKSHESNSKK